MDHRSFDPNKPELIETPLYASYSAYRINYKLKFHPNFGRLMNALKLAGVHRKTFRCYERDPVTDKWHELDTEALYDGGIITPLRKGQEDVGPRYEYT